MNLAKKLLLVSVLIFIGCAQPGLKQINNNKRSTFADYLKSLDRIALPFTHACTGPNFPGLSIPFDSAGFNKYKDRDSGRPLGLLFDDKTNIITVDLSFADYCIAPILVSYDKKGNKLD